MGYPNLLTNVYSRIRGIFIQRDSFHMMILKTYHIILLPRLIRKPACVSEIATRSVGYHMPPVVNHGAWLGRVAMNFRFTCR